MKRNFLLISVFIGIHCAAAAEQTAAASDGTTTAPACSTSETETDDLCHSGDTKATTAFTEEDTASEDGLPDEWESDWDREDIWWWCDCDDVLDAERPIHSQETWIMLRNAYRKIMGPEKSSILPTDDKNGFYVPYHAAIAPGDKGRGVFSISFIEKGTRVWTSHQHQSARFHDGHSYRQFLAAIPEDMACDVMQWAYVEDFGTEDEPKLAICADLDEGSLINDGAWRDQDDNSNVGCIPELAKKYAGGCNENLFALRLIQPGEEIMVKYKDFAITEGWDEFGL